MTALRVALIMLLLFGCTNGLEEKHKLEELSEDLKHFPRFFFTGSPQNRSFDGVVLVDDLASEQDRQTAKELIVWLSSMDEKVTESVLKGYPTYADLSKNNAILIGSCSQEPTNRFANIYVDCLSMKPNQAIIRIIEFQDKWLLFVIGRSEVETHNAINVLKDYGHYDLSGQDVEVVRDVDGYNGYHVGEPT